LFITGDIAACYNSPNVLLFLCLLSFISNLVKYQKLLLNLGECVIFLMYITPVLFNLCRVKG